MPVVDASVVVDWAAPRADPHGTAAGRLLADLVEQGAPVLAPRLLLEEVANALLTGVRRERWSGPEADDGFDLLSRLPVEPVDTRDDCSRAWDLARRYDKHPIGDMLYVATAERVQQQLVTADRALVTRLRGVGLRQGSRLNHPADGAHREPRASRCSQQLWPTIIAFVRIVSHPRVVANPQVTRRCLGRHREAARA